MDLKAMDDCVQVNDKESFQMARRLIRDEGLLCGGSSGSAVAGAIKFAERIKKEREAAGITGEPYKVLIIIPDSSSRYLSKFLNDEWLKDAGLIERDDGMSGVVDDILQKKKQQVISAAPGDALGSVIDRMKTHGISQLPVVEPGKLLGLVSEVKVLNALVKGDATMKSPVGPLAELDEAAMVERDTTLQTLSQHFSRGKVAVVVDRVGGGVSVVGLLTKIDLIEHMLK
jgi:cystathionine beta-synthase